MPSKARHEAQAQHNQRILAGLPEDAFDWRITLMMYVSLHGIRAYISDVRPGYAGNDFRYDSIPQVLEREISPAEIDLSAAFGELKRLSYKTRYQCPDRSSLGRMHSLALVKYQLVLGRLRELGVEV